MDYNVPLDTHALNLLTNYIALYPKRDHAFGLMDYVMITQDVKMQTKSPSLNVKHFHLYVQLMEIHAYLLQLAKIYQYRFLVL